MNRAKWARVAEVFDAAVKRPSAERSAYLDTVCGNDGELRREVEGLLENDDAGSAVVDRPIADTVLGWLDDNSRVKPGQHLGAFQIDSLLGVGGMGEVYRARDTRLNRDVAIKVLPVVFALDPERLARFKREAQMLASLNHPNVAAIYGLESLDGRESQDGRDGRDTVPFSVPCLVLELVEGATLAARIACGPIPLDEALPIARQIADALEAAHEQGIIHRDLKPANVKVRGDGTVKVLDFGLAKAIDRAGRAGEAAGVYRPDRPGLTASPTITTPAMTAAGMILGTAAYMSPEQAKGKPADKRSDIWSFGCVLYEMLTGERPFAGDDVADTLAAILRADPDWTALPAETPPDVARLLRRCLERDRRQRLADIADARLDLQNTVVAQPVVPTVPPARRWFPGLVGAIAFVGVASAAVSGLWFSRPSPVAEQRVVELSVPALDQIPSYVQASFALSPDGRSLAFTVQNPRVIRLRSLVSGTTTDLRGTEDGQFPFWSPDGTELGFSSSDGLKILNLSDRSVRMIAPLSTGYGGNGSWNTAGQILFNDTTSGRILRVSARGSEPPTLATATLPGHVGHFDPVWLPDDRHFLFRARGSAAVSGLWVGSVEGGGVKRLLASTGSGAYLDGHLIVAVGGQLLSYPFDMGQLSLSGSGQPLVGSPEGKEPITFAVASGGTIAFQRAVQNTLAPLIWFDRGGRELEHIEDPGDFNQINLSRDGSQVIMRRMTSDVPNIWSYDLRRKTWTPLTRAESGYTQPVFSPDGLNIAVNAATPDAQFISTMEARPAAAEHQILSDDRVKKLNDWSSDDQIIYSGPELRLWSVSVDGSGKPRPLTSANSNSRDAQVSPNGRWLAYQASDSGRWEIYVQPYPGPGERVAVSTQGGAQVRWSSNGNELFYLSLDGYLTSVPVRATSSQATRFEFGDAVRLFALRTLGGVVPTGGNRQMYAVSPDGQRFLVASAPAQSISTMTLVLNWRAPVSAEASR